MLGDVSLDPLISECDVLDLGISLADGALGLILLLSSSLEEDMLRRCSGPTLIGLLVVVLS